MIFGLIQLKCDQFELDALAYGKVIVTDISAIQIAAPERGVGNASILAAAIQFKKQTANLNPVRRAPGLRLVDDVEARRVLSPAQACRNCQQQGPVENPRNPHKH